MLELIEAGGWLMVPIVACSVVALAIILERMWTLRRSRVMPKDLVEEIRYWANGGEVTPERVNGVIGSSPLGRIIAAGLVNRYRSREILKESIEDTGRHVVHELERYLNSLGTIAAISPLLGLLGTVIGMIRVFDVITEQGVGNPSLLAGGISEALITTAAGLTVAIPSLMFYRYFRGRVDEFVIGMEQEALRLIDIIQADAVAGRRP